MHSCIYVGSVRHRRVGDVSHAFGYRLWWSFVDLSEVGLLRERGMLGRSRWSAAAWRADDHQRDRVDAVDRVERASSTPLKRQAFDGDAERLADRIRDQIETETARRPTGAVRMLTQLAHFGWYFSPLTLFYVYDGAGEHERLSAVVAEVNNTPWREQHSYVLPLTPRAALLGVDDENRQIGGATLREAGSHGLNDRAEAAGGLATREATACRKASLAAPPTRVLRAQHDKSFHVSPFMRMNREYVWRLGTPGDRLSVHIDSLPRPTERSDSEAGSESVSRFDASMLLRRRAWTRGSQLRCLVSKPLIPMWILGGIYFEALRLWWKGAAFVPHPGKL